MKLSVERPQLQHAFSLLAPVIPSRSTLPVLSHMFFETTGDSVLQGSASDLDTFIRVQIPADIETGGALCIPGKKFTEIVREQPDGSIALSNGASAIHISAGNSRFKINTLEDKEFPSMPALDWETAVELPAAVLHQMIERTAFAASSEETRPILNGVLWQIEDGQMTMVATNGHKLARFIVPMEHEAPTGDLIIHPRALNAIRRAISPDQMVSMARNENWIGFKTPTVEIYTRLIEGPYPNYQQVIPVDNDKHFTANVADLTAAIRRMAIIASDQTHRIKLTLDGDHLGLSVETPDLGGGVDKVAIDYEGEEFEIGFNALYLLEVLKNMQSTAVQVALKSPERPATFAPVGEGDQPNFLQLVMPLRLLN